MDGRAGQGKGRIFDTTGQEGKIGMNNNNPRIHAQQTHTQPSRESCVCLREVALDFYFEAGQAEQLVQVIINSEQ